MAQAQQLKMEFRSLLNPAPCETVPAGEAIYEWEYLDEAGELQKERRNVQAMIQSYERQVDYKARIEAGEEVNDNASGIYMDLSKLGTDYNGLDNWLASVAERVKRYMETPNVAAADSKNSNPDPKTGGESGSNPPETPESADPKPAEGGQQS